MLRRLLIPLTLTLAGAFAAHAAEWPDKPIRIIVPYTAGAGLDPVARIVAQQLSKNLQTAVVVENRPGVNGTVGTASAATSPPDGSTILFSGVPEVAINQFLMPNLPYSPEKDLKPVTQLASLPLVLVTGASKPWNDIPALLADARERPEKISFTSSGLGGPQHLAAAQIEKMGNVRMTHVPYKGTAPAIIDMLSGQVDVGFIGLPSARSYLAAGKLKARSFPPQRRRNISAPSNP